MGMATEHEFPRKSELKNYKIVFSDLDGTILDKKTYSYDRSLSAIHWLTENKIPLIFCSAKTKAEMNLFRNNLEVKDPYIVENGSAIIIPEGTFPLASEHLDVSTIKIGRELREFRDGLKAVLESSDITYDSFEEMTNNDVSQYTGLNLEQAALARKREYTTTLVFPSSEMLVKARTAIESIGLTCFSGGKTLTVGSGGNKGCAVRKLLGLYAQTFGNVVSYAFGDGENDISMLNEVDFPILVESSVGTWTNNNLQNIIKIASVGPEGFAKGVELIVKRRTT